MAPLAVRAASEGRALTVQDGTEWATSPLVTLGTERVGEVDATWSAGRATHAFREVGYAFDPSVGIDVKAAELLDLCEGSDDPDIATLGAIAAHALATMGANALVRAS